MARFAATDLPRGEAVEGRLTCGQRLPDPSEENNRDELKVVESVWLLRHVLLSRDDAIQRRLACSKRPRHAQSQGDLGVDDAAKVKETRTQDRCELIEALEQLNGNASAFLDTLTLGLRH